jgi:hypothetical protein
MEEARRLREEAAKIPDGMARHLLLQQAFRTETAVNLDRWLSSPGWHPPELGRLRHPLAKNCG